MTLYSNTNTYTFVSSLFFIWILSVGNLKAHNLWIETEPAGKTGQTQKVHVYYGEYSYDYYEEVSGHFKDVENFTLWLVAPDGKKTKLEVTAGEKRYTARFTPDLTGVYTLVLNSSETEVVDWTEYDLGVLKPNFYASASVIVHAEKSPNLSTLTSSNKLVILDDEPAPYIINSTVDLQILFEGKPVAEQELIVNISDQWSKTVYTNKEGVAEFTLPWQGQYVIEAVYTENTHGSYNGKEYASVRHTATYCIKTLSR